eukprot:Hpha_TRINITY_DN20976_c0_g1::TRINITY_DN20976_c0_g1_i1::g.139738::m.139738
MLWRAGLFVVVGAVVVHWLFSPREEIQYSSNGKRVLTKELLEHPSYPPIVDFVNWVLDSRKKNLFSLDADTLVEVARARTGLTKLWHDEEHWRSGLNALLRSLNEECRHVTPFGFYAAREAIIGALTAQLRMRALVDEHPEIQDEPISEPVILAGLPRTGSTHLHRLLGEALPTTRFLPFFEGFEPVAPAGINGSRIGGAEDGRVRRAGLAIDVMNWMRPSGPLLQLMLPEAAFEEIQLMTHVFGTMLYEAMFQGTHSYSQWYTSTPQTPTYRYVKACLKVVQWQRGGAKRRWVLKTPQNADHLGALLEVFPDAKIVATHRDVLPVITSSATLMGYFHGGYHSKVFTRDIARKWFHRFNWTLHRFVPNLERLSPSQVLHVRFTDFMKDQIGTVRRVSEWAGLGWGAEYEAAVQGHLDSNPRRGGASFAYSLDPFEITESAVQAEFDWYSQWFVQR